MSRERLAGPAFLHSPMTVKGVWFDSEPVLGPHRPGDTPTVPSGWWGGGGKRPELGVPRGLAIRPTGGGKGDVCLAQPKLATLSACLLTSPGHGAQAPPYPRLREAALCKARAGERSSGALLPGPGTAADLWDSAAFPSPLPTPPHPTRCCCLLLQEASPACHGVTMQLLALGCLWFTLPWLQVGSGPVWGAVSTGQQGGSAGGPVGAGFNCWLCRGSWGWKLGPSATPASSSLSVRT